MRPNGVVDSARNLLPSGHLCWSFPDRDDFLTRAREYAADGVRAGQWIEYVGDADPQTLQAEFTAVAGADLLERGGYAIKHVSDFYGFDESGVVDPERSVAKRVAASEQAVAEGWTGFRAVVDATAVARAPEQRSAFARFEHLIDRRMAAAPVTALCAYDAAIGEQALAEVACLHPWTGRGISPFRLFAGADDSGLALAGEVDVGCVELFAGALAHVPGLHDGGTLVIDAAGADFIDHRGLLELEEFAANAGVTIELRQAAPVTVRLAELLELGALRTEPVR